MAAPSANLFGHISPTTAEHVLADLDGRIDAVLDAGPTDHGVESTVLDPCRSPMVIYRPGAVTADQIRAVSGAVEHFNEAAVPAALPAGGLPSPGVGLRHYAPRARLIAFEAALPEFAHAWMCLPASARASASDCSCPRELLLPSAQRCTMCFRGAAGTHPRKWRAPSMRVCATSTPRGCTVILCPLPSEEGIGAAIRDRLKKAGTQKTANEGTTE